MITWYSGAYSTFENFDPSTNSISLNIAKLIIGYYICIFWSVKHLKKIIINLYKKLITVTNKLNPKSVIENSS